MKTKLNIHKWNKLVSISISIASVLFAGLAIYGYFKFTEYDITLKDKHYEAELTAPRGWVIDTKNGRRNGHPLLLYPNGATINNTPVVIFPNIVYKPVKNNFYASIDKVFDVLANIKGGVTASDLGMVTTKDSKKAIIKQIYTNRKKSHEIYAFIESEHSLCMIIMTTKIENNLYEYKNDFDSIVKSFKMIAEKAP